VYGKAEARLHSFLTSQLDRGVWPALRPCKLCTEYSLNRKLGGTHSLPGNKIPRKSSLYRSHYIDWAIQIPYNRSFKVNLMPTSSLLHKHSCYMYCTSWYWGHSKKLFRMSSVFSTMQSFWVQRHMAHPVYREWRMQFVITHNKSTTAFSSVTMGLSKSVNAPNIGHQQNTLTL